MKKRCLVCLSALLLVLCAACGDSQPSAEPPAPSSAPEVQQSPDGEILQPEDDPFADMEEITLVYNSTRNQNSDTPQIQWLESITEASGGKVQFDMYMSNSLVTNTRDLPEAVRSGICDITVLNLSGYSNLFPLNYNLFSIPFSGITNDVRADLPGYMYEKYPALEQEFTDQGFKLLGYNITNASNIGVKLGREYTGIEDLVGMKIISSTNTEMAFIQDIGAVPTSISFPEMYQSLEKNVANGFLNHSGPAYYNAFHENIDNWLELGVDSGYGYNLVCWVMRLETWEALPDTVKALFEETEPARAQAELATQVETDQLLRETLAAEGKYWVTIEGEDLEAYQAVMEPIVEQALAELENNYPGFTEMYRDLQDYCAGN